MHLGGKRADGVHTEVNGLAVVFDTCWRDSVLRIYCVFRIRPGHAELISQSGPGAGRSRWGSCKRIGVAAAARESQT